MNLHEYQAKKLFAEFGIPVPPGRPAHSISEALANASSVKGHGWVVKAQVHAGGRGKAGGVRIARDLEELEAIVRDMLGRRLVTRQSGPEGKPVNTVLIEATTEIERELYLALTVDRASRRVAIMASTEGGMDIEEVAASNPERIHTVTIDPLLGLQGYQCRRLAKALELRDGLDGELTRILRALYRLFMERDLSLVEINPLVVNGEGHLQALDAKINIDDNALYRQDDLAEWHDPTQEDPREAVAKRFDLNYVALDGDIGCMVNGAGLAMATMDIIKLHGGRPANFLDVGGGATADRVAEAFKIIVDTPELKAILVNIFGGIVRCDLIADGVVSAIREVGVPVPVVVRLEGTNVEQGLKIIEQSGLDIIAAEDLNDAAVKVVAAARGEQP
ncbi:MAG: ADP-forming succinate--CoA ligase subunit beta [Gammaproteobacteria bacterium]|nr:MAG: ADP-forming succinate--CoA ligase subunit beta [Gammaproteobacteria bacterium]